MTDDLTLAGYETDEGFFGSEGADGAVSLDPAVIGLVDELIASAPAGREGLVPVLLALQRAFDRVSWRVQELVADRFGMSPAQVAGVVSYYPALSATRRGPLKIAVCTGTDCHQRGGDRILEILVRAIGEGGLRAEGSPRLAVERERCLGLCGLAPVFRARERVETAGDPGVIEAVARSLLPPEQPGEGSE